MGAEVWHSLQQNGPEPGTGAPDTPLRLSAKAAKMTVANVQSTFVRLLCEPMDGGSQPFHARWGHNQKQRNTQCVQQIMPAGLSRTRMKASGLATSHVCRDSLRLCVCVWENSGPGT